MAAEGDPVAETSRN